MVQLLSVDAGNFDTKVVHARGYDKFFSQIGEWRKRKATDAHSNQDMDFHIINKYDDIKGFAGPLASLESEYGGTTFGVSKNHQDARIRILLAIHRNLIEPNINLVVGQPYASHTDEEKAEIIDSLVGEHTVTVNKKIKKFNINNVLVGIEGAMAFWSNPIEGAVNVIDVGSGTINCIHFVNKRIVDRKCKTLSFGSETNSSGVNYEGMANAIFKQMSSHWNKNDVTLVCGGSATKMVEPLTKYYSNAQLLSPRVVIGDVSVPLDTQFSNAAGMFIAGRKQYDKL